MSNIFKYIYLSNIFNFSTTFSRLINPFERNQAKNEQNYAFRERLSHIPFEIFLLIRLKGFSSFYQQLFFVYLLAFHISLQDLHDKLLVQSHFVYLQV